MLRLNLKVNLTLFLTLLLAFLLGRIEIDWVNDVAVVNARLAVAPSASNYELVGSAISGPFAVAAAPGANLAPLYRCVLLRTRTVITTLHCVPFVVLQVV